MKSILVILLVHQCLAQIEVNGTCYTDTECITYCCDNNANYTISGLCKEVSEDARCELRKKNDLIGLVCTLLAVWIAVISCGIAKVRQEKRKKEELMEIRIKGISDYANEGPAPFVQ